jgi:hypothetical protein
MGGVMQITLSKEVLEKLEELRLRILRSHQGIDQKSLEGLVVDIIDDSVDVWLDAYEEYRTPVTDA